MPERFRWINPFKPSHMHVCMPKTARPPLSPERRTWRSKHEAKRGCVKKMCASKGASVRNVRHARGGNDGVVWVTP
eukprot:6178910-Pleurochrysis_carterae.AAC.3